MSRVATELDEAVHPAGRALREAGCPAPDALFLLATGLGGLPGSLEPVQRFFLGDVVAVPECWREGELITGRVGGLSVWALADAPSGYDFGESRVPHEPAWARAWPVWLARSAGAQVCLHSSAGVRVGGPELGPALGSLAILSDHVNLSGTSPLLGLGTTRLGPLFPDQSHLHDADLRAAALSTAALAGIDAGEAIAACVLGPALDTPAELEFYARAGTQIAVQGLADPVIACAHAGLALIAISAVTDDGTRPIDLARVLELADAIAPGLEELILALGPDIARVARRRREEGA
jgi:purine-nucleoside phosphorylase